MVRWRSNVSFAVIFVFAIFVTAGATKLVHAAGRVFELADQRTPLASVAIDILQAILGFALLWAGVVLYKAQTRRPWLLQALLGLTLALELGEFTRWGTSLRNLDALPLPYAFIWGMYLLGVFLLSTAKVRDHLRSYTERAN